jgi:hypothetical protein
LVFASVGYLVDSPARGASTVPGRSALTVRVRAPFWLIPGDIFAAAPVLAFVSPKKLRTMAIQAANGGLIPWQSGIPTRIGRFQFVLGREVAFNFFRQNDHAPMLVPTLAPLGHALVRVSSLEVDFPVIEYRPFHTFSMKDSSSLLVQFYSGFDSPTGSTLVSPVNVSPPPLHTVGLIGIRVAFDWRRYLR